MGRPSLLRVLLPLPKLPPRSRRGRSRSALGAAALACLLLCATGAVAAGIGLGFEEILHGDADASEDLGWAVDLADGVLVAGEPRHLDGGFRKGRAHVAELDPVSGEWRFVATLESSDPQTSDGFGRDVAVDGTILVVGADDLGAAFVYERQEDGHWLETARLTGSGQGVEDEFGSEVEIEGETIMVGSQLFEEATGAVWVFERDPVDGWVETARLQPAGAQEHGVFGNDIALEGETLVIAAALDDRQGQDAGAVYVFERDPVSGVWSEVQTLLASDGDDGDIFGSDVALEGDSLVVGAYRVLLGGAAYVFERDPADGSWAEVVKLVAPDHAAVDDFGFDISLDHGLLAIGAPGEDSRVFEGGAVYLYHRDRGGPGAWGFMAKLLPPLIGGLAQEYQAFGNAVALDRGLLAVGGESDRRSSSRVFLLRARPVVPRIALTGSCPGRVTATLSGLQSYGLFDLYAGQPGGVTVVDSGACLGVSLALSEARLLAQGVALEDGSRRRSGDVPAGACELLFQLLDRTSCAVSEVALLP